MLWAKTTFLFNFECVAGNELITVNRNCQTNVVSGAQHDVRLETSRRFIPGHDFREISQSRLEIPQDKKCISSIILRLDCSVLPVSSYIYDIHFIDRPPSLKWPWLYPIDRFCRLLKNECRLPWLLWFQLLLNSHKSNSINDWYVGSAMEWLSPTSNDI